MTKYHIYTRGIRPTLIKVCDSRLEAKYYVLHLVRLPHEYQIIKIVN